mgnify:CR=1 FL=1
MSIELLNLAKNIFGKSPETKSRLEQITGKRVIFKLRDGENREALESSFENMYAHTRGNMDCFEKQFALVRAIYFEELDGEDESYVGRLTRNLTINSKYLSEELDFLPHELAHLWHFKLEFRKYSRLK